MRSTRRAPYRCSSQRTRASSYRVSRDGDHRDAPRARLPVQSPPQLPPRPLPNHEIDDQQRGLEGVDHGEALGDEVGGRDIEPLVLQQRADQVEEVGLAVDRQDVLPPRASPFIRAFRILRRLALPLEVRDQRSDLRLHIDDRLLGARRLPLVALGQRAGAERRQAAQVPFKPLDMIVDDHWPPVWKFRRQEYSITGADRIANATVCQV